MMKQKVQVQVRFAYGQQRVYPMNEIARLLLKLAASRTFSPADLALVQQMGYEIEYVPVTLDAVQQLRQEDADEQAE